MGGAVRAQQLLDRVVGGGVRAARHQTAQLAPAWVPGQWTGVGAGGHLLVRAGSPASDSGSFYRHEPRKSEDRGLRFLCTTSARAPMNAGWVLGSSMRWKAMPASSASCLAATSRS